MIDNVKARGNAYTHGLTSSWLSPETAARLRKLADALAEGSLDDDVQSVSGKLAGLRVTLESVRSLKVQVYADWAKMGQSSRFQVEDTEFGDGNVDTQVERIPAALGVSFLKDLERLDTYERRVLSRCRKTMFALALAFEQERLSLRR